MSTTLPFPQGGPSGGAPPPGPATPLPSGTAVAHLVIDRVLNEGPHNIVYLAHDGQAEGLAGVVALMEYFPRSLALRHPDGSVRARQAGDAIALSVGREAFVQDAMALERIHQPNVVHVLGSLQAHHTVYRAMAFVDGPTLERHVLGREGPAEVGQIVRLLDAMLDALEALHVAGLVHGQVRPDQILLAGGRIDRPVLLGMGSAAAEIAGHDAGPWAAPEQSAASRHDRINSATDLYMLATTAWFAATGKAPPTLRERLAHSDEWDPAEGLATLVEGPSDALGDKAHLVRALMAALELLPSARPQHVADLRGLLHPSQAQPGFSALGVAPLWVGPIPDREAQWEVIEMSARGAMPAPSAARGRGPRAATPSVAAAQQPPSHAPREATDRAQAARPPRPRSSRPAVLDEASPSSNAARKSVVSRWTIFVVFAAGLALAVGASFVLRPTVPDSNVTASPSAATPAEMPRAASAAASGIAAVPAAPVVPAAVPVAPPIRHEPVTAPAPTRARAAASAPLPASAPPVQAARQPGQGAPARSAPAPVRTITPPTVAAPKTAVRPPPGTVCGDVTGFALAYCLQEECAKPANRSLDQCVAARR